MAYPVVEEYTFIEGVDPTSTWGSYGTVLLQLIRQAVPNSYRGLIIYSATTPSVVNEFQWQKRCLWINSSTFNSFIYNNTLAKWVDITADIAIGAINDPNQIVDGTITLAKLNTVAPAGHVLQMDASGKLLVLRQLDQALAAGVISTDATYGTQLFLTKDGALTRWAGVNPLAFKDLSVPLPKIQYSGLQGQVLTVVPSGSGTALAFANPANTTSGPAGGSLAGTYPNPTLTPTGVTLGTYGGSGVIPVITVTSEGRISEVTTATATSAYAKILYQVAQGATGAFSGETFILNTIESDVGSIVLSLSNNEFELGPGKYECSLIANPCSNNPTGAIIELRTAANVSIDYATFSSRVNNEVVNIVFSSYINISVATKFKYIFDCPGTDTLQFNADQAANIATYAERYTQVIIRKVG